MKQIFIIFFATCSLLAIAQDSLSNPILDSIVVATIDSPSHIDSHDICSKADTLIDLPIFFDEALAWLDTTECNSDTLITELPDSVYKTRLQALPFVIEVPYNEVVRRYILRYVKHSPRQLASLQRKAEYYFPIFE